MVTVYQSDGSGGWDYVDEASTAADGTYDIGGLHTGSYRVEFQDWSGEYLDECYNDKPSLDAADDVPVTAGQTTSGIDAALAVAGHITGTVTGGGGALEDVSVAAYVSDGSGGWEQVSYASTDASGAYDLGGLHTGSYRVWFSPEDQADYYLDECYNDKPTLDAADDVPVTAGQTTSGIDATLAAAGHITGTVTGGGGALEDVSVTVYEPDGSGGWEQVSYVYTDASGAYDLGGLDTGSYRVEFQDWSGDYARECYNDKPTLRAAADVPVTAGQTTSGIDADACGRRPHHRHGDGRRRCARGDRRGGLSVRRIRRLGVGLGRLHRRQRRLRPRRPEHRQLPRLVLPH